MYRQISYTIFPPQKTAARVIRFDPRKLVDENGYLKKLKELDDATALALHSVDFDGDVISEVRVDKTAARQQLMKHLGLVAQREVPEGVFAERPSPYSINRSPRIGNMTRKVEPCPTALSTRICPPWSSTRRLVKARPSPVPSCRRA